MCFRFPTYKTWGGGGGGGVEGLLIKYFICREASVLR